MKIIYFGEYTIKSSSINYYRVEKITDTFGSAKWKITLYLKNNSELEYTLIDEESLEEITDEFTEVMKEEK